MKFLLNFFSVFLVKIKEIAIEIVRKFPFFHSSTKSKQFGNLWLKTKQSNSESLVTCSNCLVHLFKVVWVNNFNYRIFCLMFSLERRWVFWRPNIACVHFQCDAFLYRQPETRNWSIFQSMIRPGLQHLNSTDHQWIAWIQHCCRIFPMLWLKSAKIGQKVSFWHRWVSMLLYDKWKLSKNLLYLNFSHHQPCFLQVWT